MLWPKVTKMMETQVAQGGAQVVADISHITTDYKALSEGRADTQNVENPQDSSTGTIDNPNKSLLPDPLPPDAPKCAARADATAASKKRRKHQLMKR